MIPEFLAKVAVAILLAAAPTGDAQVPPTTGDAQVQEDDPGWDCRTMGNRICGDQTTRDLYYEVYQWCTDQFLSKEKEDACQWGAAAMTTKVQQQQGKRV